MRTAIEQDAAIKRLDGLFSVLETLDDPYASSSDKETAAEWLRSREGYQAVILAKCKGQDLDALARERRAASGNLGRYVNEDAPTQEITS